MREVTEPYDPLLNRPSVNQDQTAKALWELAGSIKRELDKNPGADLGDAQVALKIFLVAATSAPEAVRQVMAVAADSVPLGEDIVNISWVIQNQLKPFRPSTP